MTVLSTTCQHWNDWMGAFQNSTSRPGRQYVAYSTQKNNRLWLTEYINDQCAGDSILG